MTIILKLTILNIYVKIISNELTVVIRSEFLHKNLKFYYSTNLTHSQFLEGLKCESK